MDANTIDGIIANWDNNVDDITSRLNRIFNGYLGSDTGDCPDELQSNHLLITQLIDAFRARI
jgi:hypothetical protein